ncbi:MAG: hypothetical protein NT119_09995 [Actinobacteria bacterium]|nr:hypothetical protein [Actinomycetota bacterium]
MFASVIFGIYNWIKANLWAFALSITAAILSIISNRSGVGWSWDSTDYVAVGTNFANGRGLLDVTGLPMTVRPPGLSVLIAAGISVGLSANLFLLLLNATCAFIVVIFTFALLQRALNNRVILIVATAFVAFSPALLWQYSMAWSEPPFLAVLLIAMFISRQKMSYTKAALMPLLMAALFFIRYVGPVFAVALTISSLFINRKQLGLIRSAVINSAGFAISFIPCWLWLIRNKRIDGTLTGARAPGGGSLIDPLKTLTGTLGTWVLAKPFEGGIYMSWLDYPATAKFAGSLVVIIIVTLTLIIGVKKLKVARQNENNSDVLLVCVAVVISYICFSAYRFVHWELGPLDNRMMIPIYVPMIVLIAIAVERTITNQKHIRLIISAGFIALFGLHLVSVTKDALEFGNDGRHWSGKGFQELPIHEFVKTLPAKSLILSNQPQQLFSISKRPPVFNQYQLDAAQKRRCGHRYFVWYNTLYNDGTPNTESMPQGATSIFSDSWGTIFDLGTCRDDINFYWP